MKPLQIAIDGPVASGKSSVAARLAKRLGCAFLDTGALYRAVAWLALARGLPLDDEARIVELLEREPPAIRFDERSARAVIEAGGRELDRELFSPEVARAVSPIAAMRRVRARLVPIQRDFADERNVVMAGRDIGTVILPHALAKFYLTASLDARVERRYRQVAARGLSVEPAALRKQIEQRDARDSNREASPLAAAPDAVTIDTTELTLEQVVDELERRVRALAGDERWLPKSAADA